MAPTFKTNDNHHPTEETLDRALARVWETQWRFKRSSQTLKSQAEIAVYTIKRIVTGLSGLAPREYVEVRASDVTQMHIQQATSGWYADGLSPATINKRLNCLSKLGVSVDGCRVKAPKQLKWHLPLDRVQEVAFWIEEEADRATVPYDLARYVRWTVHTGLRLEETLRLTRDSFTPGYKDVMVPGTKTATSQATLPLASYPRMLASSQCLDAEAGHGCYRFMDSSYEELHAGWDVVRKHFGWQDDPTATLKALRRSAARYLHVDCGMPLHMVQQYLRHESMDTTLEYLRLTGGYGTEEMRRYLK